MKNRVLIFIDDDLNVFHAADEGITVEVIDEGFDPIPVGFEDLAERLGIEEVDSDE